MKFVMLMFGSPVVISLMLMPRMPSDSAALMAEVGLRRVRRCVRVADAELVHESVDSAPSSS